MSKPAMLDGEIDLGPLGRAEATLIAANLKYLAAWEAYQAAFMLRASHWAILWDAVKEAHGQLLTAAFAVRQAREGYP